MSQAERILEMLRDGQWHCGNEFLSQFMPRYSAVIHTLRHGRNYGIEGVPCDLHDTPGHSVFKFRLVARPASDTPREQTTWIDPVSGEVVRF